MNRALLFSCTFFALTLAPLPAAAKNQAGQPDVIEKFNAFRNERNEKQTIMWGTFDQKYFPQVDFMDHKMLREHLALQLKIAMTVAAEMIKVKGAQFDKGQQCESAKSTLGLEAKAEEEAEASADE